MTVTPTSQQPGQPERPKLSDQAVAALPLSSGRAELLEEIMSTPVLDHRDPAPAPPSPHRAQRWLVPAAAAALVVGMVGVPVWLTQDGGEGDAGGTSGVAGDPTPAVEEPAGYRAVLGVGGWQADHVSDHPRQGGEVSYVHGDQSLEINWRPAETHETYVEDRSENGPGRAIEMLSKPALLWAYSADDHTAIREPELGFLLEVRGSGMDEAAFLELMTHLRLVDEAGFEAALPAGFVSSAEREAEIQDMLAGIARFTDPVFPPGASTEISSTEPDRYHLGADVTAAVTCAWVRDFRDAGAAGDDARMEAAVEALAGSRQWPVLLEMDERGDWPEEIWWYADRIAKGEVPPDLEAPGGICRRG